MEVSHRVQDIVEQHQGECELEKVQGSVKLWYDSYQMACEKSGKTQDWLKFALTELGQGCGSLVHMRPTRQPPDHQ